MMPPEPETEGRSRFGGLLALLLAALQVLNPARSREAPAHAEHSLAGEPGREPDAGAPVDGNSETVIPTGPDASGAPVPGVPAEKSPSLRELLLKILQ